MDVIFCCFSAHDAAIYQQLFRSLNVDGEAKHIYFRWNRDMEL